ncbi:MAG: amino acid-binding protein [Methanobacteriaceae archaeon]|nr:amino acid-binding protein [Methanobacteriaceae archaeon]
MKLNIVVEIPDTPGQLINLLKPIGSKGANITSVIHNHELKTKRGTLPIHLTLTGDKSVLNETIKSVKEEFPIVKIDDELQKEKQLIIFLGDITTPDINNTIDRINNIPDVKVIDVSLKISDKVEESVSKFIIETVNGNMDKAVEEITKITKDNNLVMIKEI